MDLCDITRKDLAKKMEVSEASVCNWLKGIKVPRADKVDKMCSIFGCNRSDLVSEDVTAYSAITQKHLENYAHLNQEWKDLIDELIKALQEEPPNSAKILGLIGKISLYLQS